LLFAPIGGRKEQSFGSLSGSRSQADARHIIPQRYFLTLKELTRARVVHEPTHPYPGGCKMALDSLNALFEDTLRDMYYAEKKLTRILPKMAKKASTPDLADAFTAHAKETKDQVERIEKVFKLLDKTPRAKKCEALEGLQAEGEHVMEEAEEDGVMDAGLIASAQAVEHYEIARYGTLIAWAKQLDMADAADLLVESLEEEKAADEKLNGIAEKVNPMAEHAQAA
jgi:ferritin-like metal-binding protein YciE